MTEPDIVVELDRWLTEPAFDLAQEEQELLQRARDEIAALREYKASVAAHIIRVRRFDIEAIQRTRDEIMALRKMHTPEHFQRVHDATRAEALEEAAQRCEQYSVWIHGDMTSANFAKLIRALKDKP